MKKQILTLGLILSSHAYAADSKICQKESIRLNELRSMLERFDKDCERYPETLTLLLDQPSDCPKWNGPYLKDKTEYREMLTHHTYTVTAAGFDLKSQICPEAK